MVRHCWNIEIKGQRHDIEVLSNTIVGFFATGGGRLLVDGKTVCDWGCNPLTIIPKGRLDVEVGGKRASIMTKGRFTNYLVLVIDAQEMPSVAFKS